jgi:riboflavin synthase
MFAGIIEELGQVVQVEAQPPGRRLVIAGPQVSSDAKIGASVAVNGCCLTVVQRSGDRLAFDAGPETLQRTNLGELQPGSEVNLERSLQIGDRLGGHFVTGHIDAIGWVEQRLDDRDWSTFWFRCPSWLTREMASKGSVAVDGVSLTLVDVHEDAFSVALIPHTLQVTTLGRKGPGSSVNLETDLLAKYVRRQMEGSRDASV